MGVVELITDYIGVDVVFTAEGVKFTFIPGHGSIVAALKGTVVS